MAPTMASIIYPLYQLSDPAVVGIYRHPVVPWAQLMCQVLNVVSQDNACCIFLFAVDLGSGTSHYFITWVRGGGTKVEHLTNKEVLTMSCSVGNHVGSGQSTKELWEKTRDYVTCFSRLLECLRYL